MNGSCDVTFGEVEGLIADLAMMGAPIAGNMLGNRLRVLGVDYSVVKDNGKVSEIEAGVVVIEILEMEGLERRPVVGSADRIIIEEFSTREVLLVMPAGYWDEETDVPLTQPPVSEETRTIGLHLPQLLFRISA